MPIDIEKIILIESSGWTDAVNKKSGAIGLMQITPICLKHINEYSEGFNGKTYTEESLKDPIANKNAGSLYMNKIIPEMLACYSIPVNDMNCLIAYNWGIGNFKNWYMQLPEETRGYIHKYQMLKIKENL